MLFSINDCEKNCEDVIKRVTFPHLDMDVDKISVIIISEAPPEDMSDYYYASSDGAFFNTTRTVFQDAGFNIDSYEDFYEFGIYFTTAIKCPKLQYTVKAKTINNCSEYLESEIFQFPNLEVIMCMGDFSIKSVNKIFKKRFGIYPISKGPTYKIRQNIHQFKRYRFFPSYTQTGDSFNIEKSKRKMIAEDIKNAMDYLGKK